MRIALIAGLGVLSLTCNAAFGRDIVCEVSDKTGFPSQGASKEPFTRYPKAALDSSKFSSVIRENESGKLELGRCSFEQAAGAVTCDYYLVDYVYTDPNVGISKYYYFSGQLDLQIYPDMTFIENNGRGSISFGTCLIGN